MEYRVYKPHVMIRLDDGDELLTALTQVCRECGIHAGLISGIGATRQLRTRVADLDAESFVYRDLTDSMEITSLTGNITDNGGEPFLHVHITAADRQMQVYGGHVVSCVISATAEVCITILDGKMAREESDNPFLKKIVFQ